MEKQFRCLICNCVVGECSVDLHKSAVHNSIKHYGLMWPLEVERNIIRDLWTVPIYESESIAKTLGVSKVYIRDEGMNFSGSMKDYSVENYSSLKLGLQMNYEIYRYQSDFYGPDASRHSRIFLRKNLSHGEVFSGKGDVPSSVVVPVAFNDGYDPSAHLRINELLSNGYRGVAVDERGIHFTE